MVLKNLVVKNFKSLLLKKIESIKEPPINILKRFDGYLQKDKQSQANKKATGQSLNCVMIKILKSSIEAPVSEDSVDADIFDDTDGAEEDDPTLDNDMTNNSRMEMLGRSMSKFKKKLSNK